MTHQTIILAAGKGTRMAAPVPKVLVQLKGKPLIGHLLKEVNKLEQATPPVIVVGYQHEVVKESLGPSYVYAHQREQNGTAHAVLSAKPKVVADYITVICGDMPFVKAKSLELLRDLHTTSNAKVSMLTSALPNFDGFYSHFMSFGRIIRDENGNVSKIREFADASDSEKTISEVNPGIYIFDTVWLWEHMDKIGKGNAQGEFYLTDIIEVAMQSGEIVSTASISPEETFGINTPDHLEFASSLIKDVMHANS